jgi:DNA mismatch repair ATPase MutS
LNSTIKDGIKSCINNYVEKEVRQKRTSNHISNVRLIVVAIGASIAIFFMKHGQAEDSVYLLVITFLIFYYLVKRHQKINRELKRTSCKIEINQRHLDRMSDDWTTFKDDGKEFLDVNHSYANDLDIFGPKSLFQWMNETNTFHGRQALQRLLAIPGKDADLIKMRQQAVRELAEKSDFCEELQCEGMLAVGSSNNPDLLMRYVKDAKPLFKGRWMKAGSFLVPCLTIIGIIAAVISESVLSFYLVIFLILFQVSITGIGYSRVSKILDTVHRFRASIKNYEKLIKIIETQEFEAPELSKMQRELKHKNNSASRGIKKLERIVEAIDLRYNAISYMMLNFTLLWDYHCVFALENWKNEYGVLIEKWLTTIGDFEAVSSLAIIARLNPEWNFPLFNNEKLFLTGEELGHPLLSQEKRVCNNADIRNEICVITGSNMSGKTTWLRTIGINLVLAYSGAPVCATKLECSIMDIVTSMRINDDLGSGISTFYAELLRIKTIIDHSNKQREMIFLIDEIFRGTNSNDRIIGAISVLKSLKKDWNMGLISTHDLELCNLEYDLGIRAANYHFIEHYESGTICFDYKIRQGRCNSTNAKYLMRMVGIELAD